MKFYLSLIVLLFAFGQVANADAVFSESYASQDSPPAHAVAGTGRKAKLNESVFKAAVVTITLPDDTALTFIRSTVDYDLDNKTKQWSGVTADGLGTAVFAGYKGTVTGTVNYNGSTWEIVPTTGGKHQIYEVTPSDNTDEDFDAASGVTEVRNFVAPDGGMVAMSGSGSHSTYGAACSNAGCASAASPAQIDILVYYTAAAATLYTADVVKSKALAAIQAGNTAAAQSAAYINFNVLAIEASPIQESGTGMVQTYNNLKVNATAIARRNALYADTVVLISNETGGVHGVGGGWWSWSNGTVTAYDGWAVVGAAYLGDYSLAHELGHTLGLDHNRENTTSTSPGYHYGHRVCNVNGFRTIMAYDCTSTVPVVGYYSNPSITLNTYPAGVLYSLSPDTSTTTASENSRSLNENAPWVTRLRQVPVDTVPPAAVPGAPLNFTVTPSTGLKITLAWTLQDAYATSIVIQRGNYNDKSSQWSNYSTLATLAGTATGFADRVSKVKQYRYQVIAKNSAGSATSSAVTATATR